MLIGKNPLKEQPDWFKKNIEIIPLSNTVFKISGCGFVFTAYKTLPGKFFLKNSVDVFIDSGLMQYAG